MKMNNGNQTIWRFPREIDFSLVSQYLKMMEKYNPDHVLVFDLNDTETIHSSFIGFLIHAKEKLEHDGVLLVLEMSPSLRKLMTRMKLSEYFTPVLKTPPPSMDKHISLH